MKKNAFIINAARGGIIDEGALLAALNDKKIAGAALDVFEQEPPPQEYALVNHPKVIVTPHLGASTSEAQERVAVQIAEQVKAFLENGTITNAVNAPNLTGHQLASVQPLMDMAHMLGNFVAQSEPLQPSKITISLCNPPGILTQTPIWHSALAGFLSVRYGQPISWMLAPHKAMRLGIEVVESYQTGNTVQASSVTIDTGSHRITGTLFPGKGPRISNIDGFEIEALPSAHMLLLQNKDVPGVIGQIGTCLGGENVNVSRMQLGLSLEKQALSLWNLDGPLSLEQLKKIQNLPSVSKATLVDLLI